MQRFQGVSEPSRIIADIGLDDSVSATLRSHSIADIQKKPQKCGDFRILCVHTVLFRSAFRDWVAEETAYPGEVAEAALAHAIPNKGEAAQARRHGPAVLDALAGIGMARRLKDGWYAA